MNTKINIELKSFLLFTALIIALFLIFGDLGFGERLMEQYKEHPIAVMIICMLLLILDIILPLPSSIIMVLTGSLLGPWIGLFTNYIGINISNLIGYGLGHSWPDQFLFKKPRGKIAVDRNMIIIGTRGVPVLAESVSITAGYANYPFRKYLFSILIGNAPYCIIYSLAGFLAFKNFEMLIAFGLNMLLILSIFIIQQVKLKQQLES